MAQEVMERPAAGAAPGSSEVGTKQNRNLLNRLTRRGESASGSPPPPSQRAELRHSAGHDARRRGEPSTTLEEPHGRERPLQRESEISEKLVDQLTSTLRTDMDQLIELKRDMPDADFRKFLTDSGHGYYLPLVDRFVEEKPGTRGRELSIKEDALKEFMSVDRGVAQAYKILQLKMQEQAMAAAIVLSHSPNEPSNPLPGPGSVELTQGGPLRGPARAVRHWWHTERRTNGRVGGDPADSAADWWAGVRAGEHRGSLMRLMVDTKGRLTMALGGANVASSVIGGLTFGPIGAVAGPAVVDAMAALRYASRPGETLTRNISADALRTFLGDPSSPTRRGPDTVKIEWMKKMHNMNPQDFEINSFGEIVRRGTIAETGIDYKRTLVENLNGMAKIVMDFQREDNIPEHYRRAMDVDWLLNESSDRPLQGTPFEQKVMERFNPNRGGILDTSGNTIETSGGSYFDAPEMMTINAQAVDAFTGALLTNPDGSPQISSYLVPRTEDARDASGNIRRDASGNPIRVAVVRRVPGRNPAGVQVVSTTRILDSNGDPIDVPTFASATDRHRNPLQTPAGDPILIPQTRAAVATDVQTEAFRDAAGNPAWRENPDFNWDNVDRVGNVERWLKAYTEVLKEENDIVFQSIIDGKTDHLLNLHDRISRAKEAHKSGTIVDAEKKNLDKEIKALDEDQNLVKKEGTSITDFQSEVARLRTEVTKLERKQSAVIRRIGVAGNSNPTQDEVQSALQAALSAGNTVEVTIGGESIKSIEDEYTQLEVEIGGLIDTYSTRNIEPLEQAVTDAEDQLTHASNNQEYTIKSRALDGARQRLAAALSQRNAYETNLREQGRFKDRADKIDKRRKLIEDKQTEILSNDEQLKIAREDLTSDETSGRTETEMVFQGMHEGYDQITRWGIAPADLQTESFDKLIKQINATTRPDGWPESENELAENRVMLLHAMAEARANTFEPHVGAPTPELQNVIDPAQYAISEMDLLALNNQEIKDIIDAKIAAGTIVLAPLDIGTINNIRNEALSRSAARQRALTRITTDLEKRAKKASEKMEDLESKGMSTDTLDALEKAVGRYGNIAEEVMNMPDESDINNLLGASFDNATSDWKIDEDKALRSIHDLIFKHSEDFGVKYNSEVGPDAAFKRNQTALSQTELTNLIVKHFGLRISSVTLSKALLAIREVDKKRLAEFFSSGVVFEHLMKKL